jgi:predicted TIM-barrel fold metal-dependent hydrolase
MSANVICISTDCHASPLNPDFGAYVEQKYKSDFDDWIDEHEKIMAALMRNRPPRDENDQRDLFSSQMDARLSKLESEGFVAEVIFPNGAFPFNRAFRGKSSYDIEHQQVGMMAFNRWLGETCDPERQIGLFQLHLGDPQYAANQVRHARALGLRGIMPQFDPVLDKPIDHPSYEPVWDACESEGLALHFHGAFNGVPSGLYDESSSQVFPTEFVFWTSRPLWQLIWSGVLERHPNLNVVFAETYADWIPRTLTHLDWRWRHDAYEAARAICPKRPSEYWSRQGFVTASFASSVEFKMRDEIGMSRFMYGTDFPHGPSTWGKSIPYLQATLGTSGANEDEIRDILGRNAIKLYGLDEPILQEAADKFGPSITNILERDERDELPEYLIHEAERPPAV